MRHAMGGGLNDNAAICWYIAVWLAANWLMATVSYGDTVDLLLVANVLTFMLPTVAAASAGRVTVVSLSKSLPSLISNTFYMFCCTYPCWPAVRNLGCYQST